MRPMRRCAVIFDLDGTLTRPNIDFEAIRGEIGVEGPILEAMEAMDPAARRRATEILCRHEREAAEVATLFDGARETVEACRAMGHGVAVLTRNARVTAQRVLARFAIRVDALRTRDDGAIKPSGEPILSICEALGADAARSWMVGDYLFDLQSGKAAGSGTVLMVGEKALPSFADQADHVIRTLAELLPIVDGVCD